jgi:hypothetical protein
MAQPWNPPVPRTDDLTGWPAVQQRFSEVFMHQLLYKRFGASWRLANRWSIAHQLYRYGLPV